MTIKAAKRLVECCIQAPSADNHQPFKYRYRDGFLNCVYDEARVQGRTFAPRDPATLLSAGAAYENLLQGAEALSIALQPISILNPSGSYFEVKICESPSFQSVDLSSHPIFLRHTNRNAFGHCNDLDARLSKVSTNSRAEQPLNVISNKDKIKILSKLIEGASKIRFETQEVHEWLGQSIRYGGADEQMSDGLDVDTLGLPPGGALFMKFVSDWKRMAWLNRFGMSALMAKIDAQPVSKASTLVAITGEDSEVGTMSAGRRLTSIWADLNQLGLAVQPYYVLSDLEQRLKTDRVTERHFETASQICSTTRDILELDRARLYMILRVGKAKKRAVRSRRFPIDHIFSSER